MIDANLMLRTAGAADLTQTTTSGTLSAQSQLLHGAPAKGLSFNMVLSKIGSNTTLDVKLQHSTDGTTWNDLIALPQIAPTTATVSETTPRRYSARFVSRLPLKHLRYVATTGGTGTQNFGACPMWVGEHSNADYYGYYKTGVPATANRVR